MHFYLVIHLYYNFYYYKLESINIVFYIYAYILMPVFTVLQASSFVHSFPTSHIHLILGYDHFHY